jgi:hypothetical protein
MMAAKGRLSAIKHTEEMEPRQWYNRTFYINDAFPNQEKLKADLKDNVRMVCETALSKKRNDKLYVDLLHKGLYKYKAGDYKLPAVNARRGSSQPPYPKDF